MTVKRTSLYFIDGYGNHYQYWLKPCDDTEFYDGKSVAGKWRARIDYNPNRKVAHIERYFSRKKSAVNWLERRYHAKQDRFLQVQERKKARALARKNAPKPPVDKIRIAERGVAEALKKVKEAQRKVALAHTLQMRWLRRLTARQTALEKLKKGHIDKVTRDFVDFHALYVDAS
jgi:hypothetical protein